MSRHRIIGSMGLAAGLLAAAVTAGMLAAGQQGAVSSTRGHREGGLPARQSLDSSLDLSGPNFCGGEATTPDLVPDLAGYEVYFPNSVLANASNLRRVCWCPGVEEVALEFSSGVMVQMHPSDLVNPAGLWSHWATHDYKLTAVATTMRGEPAVEFDPTLDPTGRTPGGFEWVEHGLLIAVSGNGQIPIDGLEDVSNSLTVLGPVVLW